MKIYMAIIILTTTSSCLTVNRIQRNCDKFSQLCINPVEVKTIYRDTIIYITDTIAIPLPGDTLILRDTIFIRHNMAQLPAVTKTQGIITTRAQVYNSILQIQSWLNDSSIMHIRHDTIYIQSAHKHITTKQTIDNSKIKNKKFNRGLIITLLIILALYIAKRK